MTDETTPTAEQEGSLLPAALGGAAILAAAALLIFWPSGDDIETAASAKIAAAKNAGAKAGADPKGGGVAAREFDKASGKKEVRRNPAIRLPPVGMNPNPPDPPEPPVFETKDQEIKWHKAELEKAERMLRFRNKASDRLEKLKEGIENGPNPQEGLAAFESRKKIVQDNLDAAQRRVSELNKKIEELEAG